jgi:hypothetical protein
MNTLKEIEIQKSELIESRKKSLSRITGIRPDQIGIISDDFVSFRCESMKDLRGCIDNIEPFKNGWEVKHTQTHYITSLYMVKICNGYQKRELRVEWENVGGKYWATVDIENLPVDFVARFMTATKRPLSSCETHYVSIPPHYKKFKEIRVRAFTFGPIGLKWYGGDETLSDASAISAIIDAVGQY